MIRPSVSCDAFLPSVIFTLTPNIRIHMKVEVQLNFLDVGAKH
jgi:hypothetical protein